MPMSEAVTRIERLVVCDRCGKSESFTEENTEAGFIITLPPGWAEYLNPEYVNPQGQRHGTELLYFHSKRCAKGYFRAMVEGRLPEPPKLEDDEEVEEA